MHNFGYNIIVQRYEHFLTQQQLFINMRDFYNFLTRSRSVPAPYPLRLFTGCLTVFCRRDDGEATEGLRRGYQAAQATEDGALHKVALGGIGAV